MTVRVEDTFTEGSDLTLASHTPSPTGTSWTKIATGASQTMNITAASDDVKSSLSGANTKLAYSSQPDPSSVGADEYDVTVILKTIDVGTDRFVGLFGRLTSSADYYAAGCYDAANNPDMRIGKNVGGTRTSIATGDLAPVNGDEFTFKLRTSTSRQTWRNNTQAEEITADDTEITDQGACGMCMGDMIFVSDDLDSGHRYDDYKWEDIAAGGVIASKRMLMKLGI